MKNICGWNCDGKIIASNAAIRRFNDVLDEVPALRIFEIWYDIQNQTRWEPNENVILDMFDGFGSYTILTISPSFSQQPKPHHPRHFCIMRFASCWSLFSSSGSQTVPFDWCFVLLGWYNAQPQQHMYVNPNEMWFSVCFWKPHPMGTYLS